MDPFMRVRVLMDVQEPLKREKKVRRPGGGWLMCNFKYERLPCFCYICGRLGHVDRNCEVRFRTPEANIVKLWDGRIKAPPRQVRALGGERWLVEGESSMSGGCGGDDGGEQRLDGVPRKPLSHVNLNSLHANFGASRWLADKEIGSITSVIDKEQEGLEIQVERKLSRPNGKENDGWSTDINGRMCVGGAKQTESRTPNT
ncbi:hypothetical protein LINPERHAP1_LOCUS25294 [Linum perenne]